MTVDVSVRDQGTLAVLTGETDAGRTWLDQHLPDTQGTVHAVEHRYVADILAGAREAGLTVGDA